MQDTEQDSTVFRSKAQFQYCPQCGAETDHEEVRITAWKQNLRVTCPEHGVLVLG